MTRLRHDIKAQIATFRLTTRKVIVFVEGKDLDPFFYGQITDRFGRSSDVLIGIRRAQELPGKANVQKGGSGGKGALLRAATFWERYRAKYLQGWKVKKCLLFFVDKDVDDYLGLPEFVPGIARTTLFCVENHLIANTDLVSACEIALSLAPGEVDFGQNVDAWRMRACQLWKDWVVFCLLSARIGRGAVQNYSSPSLFNDPANAPSDPAKIAFHYARLEAASGLSSKAFSDFKLTIQSLVSEEFISNRQDRLFKGKWYIEILFADLLSSPWSKEAQRVGKPGLWIALRSRFRLSEEDYEHYFTYLHDALNR